MTLDLVLHYRRLRKHDTRVYLTTHSLGSLVRGNSTTVREDSVSGCVSGYKRYLSTVQITSTSLPYAIHPSPLF